MRYRTFRVASELQVVRLLTVSATATPSQQDLTKIMLRLDVESSRVSSIVSLLCPFLDLPSVQKSVLRNSPLVVCTNQSLQYVT